jgi:hypothetical protein
MGSVTGKSLDGDAPEQQRRRPDQYVRGAYHAGSWYENDANVLTKQLETWLEQVDSDVHHQVNNGTCPPHHGRNGLSSVRESNLRAVICPHAGYSYSGSTAAYSYRAIAEEVGVSSSSSVGKEDFPTRVSPIRTIVVLHPSHHVYLKSTCAISNARIIETPCGVLLVNDELRNEILKINNHTANRTFQLMTQEEDEHEHSGEMQYPYLAHILSKISKTITVLPIMCGSLTTQDEIEYGKLLRPILNRPEVLTVISTDFCHWGRRFQYQPTSGNSRNRQQMKIHEYIAHLDRHGMDLIASQQPGEFAEYLKTTRNTICGRHAVAVWLRAMEVTSPNEKDDLNIQFLHYRQSSQVQSLQDSSVSYASAIVTSTSSPSVMINGVK